MLDATEELLKDLDPDIRDAAFELVNAARLAGIPMLIISGRRDYFTNLRVGGAPNSRHLTGRAFDVQIVGYTRDQIDLRWWKAVGEFAEQVLGLRWGGRFRVPDVNHFDG